MQSCIVLGIGKYVVLDTEYIKKSEGNIFHGLWKMSFDGACSNSVIGVWIIFHNVSSYIYHDSFILDFPCIKNEEKYEA